MKITKSQIKEIIKEELDELVVSGTLAALSALPMLYKGAKAINKKMDQAAAASVADESDEYDEGVVKEEDMDKTKIPGDLKRFLDRFIDKLKDKKLTRQKQKAILYKVVKGLGISPQELMMYVQRVKKGL